MSDAYVVGVDMIKFGRFPDRTVPNIGAESALLALDDPKEAVSAICASLKLFVYDTSRKASWPSANS